RLRPVIFNQNLDGPTFDSAFLVDDLLGQQHPVSFRLAKSRAGTRQRDHRPDLDRLALLRPDARRTSHQERCDRNRVCEPDKSAGHRSPPSDRKARSVGIAVRTLLLTRGPAAGHWKFGASVSSLGASVAGLLPCQL